MPLAGQALQTLGLCSRSANGVIWDPRAMASPVGTRKQIGALSIDASWYSNNYKDETAAAAVASCAAPTTVPPAADDAATQLSTYCLFFCPLSRAVHTGAYLFAYHVTR